MAEFTRLEAAYARYANVISDALTTEHIAVGSLADTRRVVLTVPVTTDARAWTRALQDRSDGDPRGARIEYLLEVADATTDKSTIWIDDASLVTVSVDQIVLGALYHRLFRPSHAFATRHSSDLEELITVRRAERSRLLGLVDPRWQGPLGRLAITEIAPFDEINSGAMLLAAHEEIVDRIAAVLQRCVPRDLVESAIAPDWTLNDADFIMNGGLAESLVGRFDADRWEFEYVRQERAGAFGQNIGAEQLLWGCVRDLAALADEVGEPHNKLLTAANPAWHTSYEPCPMRNRSLRLY